METYAGTIMQLTYFQQVYATRRSRAAGEFVDSFEALA